MKIFLRKMISRFRPENLTRRERLYLVAGGVAAIGMVFFGLFSMMTSYRDRMENLDRLIRQKQEAMVELAVIQREYAKLNEQIGALENRISKDQGSFSLLSFIESLAVRENVRSNIAHMRPQTGETRNQYRENAVEIKIEKVTLERAIRFLTKIEKAPHVLKIRNLHFRRRYADPQFLDITFRVSSYEKIG